MIYKCDNCFYYSPQKYQITAIIMQCYQLVVWAKRPWSPTFNYSSIEQLIFC